MADIDAVLLIVVELSVKEGDERRSLCTSLRLVRVLALECLRLLLGPLPVSCGHRPTPTVCGTLVTPYLARLARMTRPMGMTSRTVAITLSSSGSP